MTVYKNSRLVGSRVFADDDGELFLEPTVSFIAHDPRDKIYMFKDSDRLDLLAQDFYGNPQLHHIILRANPRYMHEFEIKTGDKLIIPSPERSELFE